MITQTELNVIKERAEKATPGPWILAPEKCGPEGQGVYDAESFGCICEVGDPYPRGNNRPQENMEFIANAREDIPKLVAEIERLNEIIKNYNNTIRNLDAFADSIIYETEYYGYSKMVAEKIIGLITELEKKVGDIV